MSDTVTEGVWRGLRYRVERTPDGTEYLIKDRRGWVSLGVLDAEQEADGLPHEEQLLELLRP